MKSPNQWTSRSLLLVATVVVVLAMFIPYGYLLVYPFRLFGTFIHEAAHAMAAVVSGGQVLGMHVNLDTSGLTLTRGGSDLLISSAGYLGSIVAGAALLLAGRRRKWARPALLVTAIATLLATAFFGGYGSALLAVMGFAIGMGLVAAGRRRSRGEKSGLPLVGAGALFGVASLIYLGFSGALLTWLIGLVMGGGLLLVALYAKPVWQQLTVIFLGVQVVVDGLNSVKHLLVITTGNHGHSDAANMADITGVPATFWAATWALMGVAVIAGAFWMFWRDERRHELRK